MTNPAIHMLQLAHHPSTHHANDNESEDEANVEVAYVTDDSKRTYISGKTGGAGKSSAASPTPVNDSVDFLVYRVNNTIPNRYSNDVFSDSKKNLVRRLDTKF